MGESNQQSRPETAPDEEDHNWYFSRRAMMAGTGSLAAGAVIANNIVEQSNAASTENTTQANGTQTTDTSSGNQSQEVPRANDVGDEGFEFFTSLEDARLIETLAERIFPSDDLGPGAPEAGVVFFIDRQLNGAWGEGAKQYKQGPFKPDEAPPALGWQYDLVPSEVYEYAIESLHKYITQNYNSSSITDLDSSQQDEIVSALENDDVDTFDGFNSSEFFAMLRQNVLEGMYADPIYGGNRNMVGWKIKQFPGMPGTLGSYRASIEDEEFHEIPPKSVESTIESSDLFGEGQSDPLPPGYELTQGTQTSGKGTEGTQTSGGGTEETQTASEETQTISEETQEEKATATVSSWLSDADNYESITDVTDQDSITVKNGAKGNGGNFAFAPPAIRVSTGTTVTWKWTGKGGAHNVVNKGGAFDSGEPVSESGTTFKHTFDSSGIFLYYCEPHRSLGMKGAIVVEG